MVSIIISSHNYGHLIGDTLQSVLSQSYVDFECLVIDNGSTDNTCEVVQKFLTDDRIRYFAREDRGVSAARNQGLRLAKGDFVLFLDADDLIGPGKLLRSVKFLDDHPETDLVYSDMRYFKSGNKEKLFYSYACNENYDRPWMPYVSGKGKTILRHLIEGNILPISAPVTRKKSLENVLYFNEDLRFNEDWDLWLRLALSGAGFYYLDEPGTLTLIRIHENNTSKDYFKMQCAGLKVLETHTKALEKAGLKEEVRSRTAAHFSLIRQALLECSGEVFQHRINILKSSGLFTSFFTANWPGNFVKKFMLKYFRREEANA